MKRIMFRGKEDGRMTREQAINIAVGCVMASAMDSMTKIQVIEVLRGIEKELDNKPEED